MQLFEWCCTWTFYTYRLMWDTEKKKHNWQNTWNEQYVLDKNKKFNKNNDRLFTKTTYKRSDNFDFFSGEKRVEFFDPDRYGILELEVFFLCKVN